MVFLSIIWLGIFHPMLARLQRGGHYFCAFHKPLYSIFDCLARLNRFTPQQTKS